MQKKKARSALHSAFSSDSAVLGSSVGNICHNWSDWHYDRASSGQSDISVEQELATSVLWCNSVDTGIRAQRREQMWGWVKDLAGLNAHNVLATRLHFFKALLPHLNNEDVKDPAFYLLWGWSEMIHKVRWYIHTLLSLLPTSFQTTEQLHYFGIDKLSSITQTCLHGYFKKLEEK